ncbi:CBS domain-containing protein [Candidatus Woesearchaeota archaeon]|nr:CBS domain-containing protein [Candidatus Woesearchaeota archaeon]
MKTGVRVEKVMTKHPITVPPGTSLQKCARLMTAKHVGSLLVKDGPGVVGIITEQDIVRKAVGKNLSPATHVDDIMEMKLVFVSQKQDVADAILKMRKHNIRHLPVMDAREQFVGFVTSKDILRIQPDLFRILAKK